LNEEKYSDGAFEIDDAADPATVSIRMKVNAEDVAA